MRTLVLTLIVTACSPADPDPVAVTTTQEADVEWGTSRVACLSDAPCVAPVPVPTDADVQGVFECADLYNDGIWERDGGTVLVRVAPGTTAEVVWVRW